MSPRGAQPLLVSRLDGAMAFARRRLQRLSIHDADASAAVADDAGLLQRVSHDRYREPAIRAVLRELIDAIRMIGEPDELRRGSLYTMEGRQPATLAAEIRFEH